MTNQPHFIWDDRKYVKIELADILVLQAEGNYLRFLAREYSYQVRSSLDGAIGQLPPNLFVRVHKSYAVSMRYLEEVDKDVVKVGGVNVPISRKYYLELVKKINIINQG